MATAEMSRREVKKMIEATVQEDVITLTLSKDEAETLSEIAFRHVSGSSDSPRKHSDAIHNALRNAGVDQHAIAGHARGRIHFEDYPKPEESADDSPLKIGDRVRVTSVSYNGEAGTLRRIDASDELLPYSVELDFCEDTRWVKSVERVSD